MKNKKSLMQIFHDRLFQPTDADPQMKALSKLTQMTPSQMSALSSNLDWSDWDGKDRTDNSDRDIIDRGDSDKEGENRDLPESKEEGSV